MKLYGVAQSRSFRALWALEEANLKYDYIAVQFGSTDDHGSASERYQSLNAQGKVPTLVDDELVITESGAIVNYIAANSSISSLMPVADIKLRAKYDELSYFVLTELEQGLWTSGKHRFALPKEQRVADIFPTATWEFNKAISTLEKMFDGDGFVLGEEFTMIDVLLAHTISWAESFKFEVPQPFLDYKNRMYQRAACKRALANLN